MCKPEGQLTVQEKIRHSVKQTWYGLTIIYCALMLTLIFLARVLNWQVG